MSLMDPLEVNYPCEGRPFPGLPGVQVIGQVGPDRLVLRRTVVTTEYAVVEVSPGGARVLRSVRSSVCCGHPRSLYTVLEDGLVGALIHSRPSICRDPGCPLSKDAEAHERLLRHAEETALRGTLEEVLQEVGVLVRDALDEGVGAPDAPPAWFPERARTEREVELDAEVASLRRRLEAYRRYVGRLRDLLVPEGRGGSCGGRLLCSVQVLVRDWHRRERERRGDGERVGGGAVVE